MRNDSHRQITYISTDAKSSKDFADLMSRKSYLPNIIDKIYGRL